MAVNTNPVPGSIEWFAAQQRAQAQPWGTAPQGILQPAGFAPASTQDLSPYAAAYSAYQNNQAAQAANPTPQTIFQAPAWGNQAQTSIPTAAPAGTTGILNQYGMTGSNQGIKTTPGQTIQGQYIAGAPGTPDSMGDQGRFIAGFDNAGYQTAGMQTAGMQTYDPFLRTVDPRTETVQGQLAAILDENNMVMKSARAKALVQSGRMGLDNSTLAMSAGEKAVMDVAVPIAISDAATYSQAAKDNQTVLNKALEFNANAYNENQRFNATEFNLTERANAGFANAAELTNVSESNTTRRSNALSGNELNLTNIREAGANERLAISEAGATARNAASVGAQYAQIASAEALGFAQMANDQANRAENRMAAHTGTGMSILETLNTNAMKIQTDTNLEPAAKDRLLQQLVQSSQASYSMIDVTARINIDAIINSQGGWGGMLQRYQGG